MAEQEESGFSQQVLPRRAGQVYWGTALSTLAELRNVAYEARRNNQIIFVKEVPGMYYHDQNAVDAEDSPSIIVPTDSLGRWILIFGIDGTGSDGVTVYKSITTPTTGIEGDIWYDLSTGQWRGHNGTNWSTILG